MAVKLLKLEGDGARMRFGRVMKDVFGNVYIRAGRYVLLIGGPIWGGPEYVKVF